MILAIDIGTSSIKTGIVDENGRLVSFARVRFTDRESGEVMEKSVDAYAWLSALSRALSLLDEKAIKLLRAVTVCGNGPTLIAVDSDGNPIGTPVYWTIKSAADDIHAMRDVIGGTVDPSFFIVKALAFKRDNPAEYVKTQFFLPCPEYIGFVLTGNAHAILPTREYAYYYWNDDALGRLDLDPAKFPRFVETGSVCGTITKQSAHEYRIPEGIPLVAGGPDFIMSLLGTGCVYPGGICDRAGSSEGINYCSSANPKDSRLFAVPHIFPGLINVSAILSASGASFDWLLRVLSLGGSGYGELSKLIDSVPPGCRGLVFFPHIIPERNALWGESRKGAFTGLTATHGKPEMLRSVVESTGYAVRRILGAFEENGLPVGQIRVSGGSAMSREWCGIRADITGKPILVPDIVNSELAGCACIAYTALGNFTDLANAVPSIVHIRETIEPQKELSAIYDDEYAKYRELDRVLAEHKI